MNMYFLVAGILAAFACIGHFTMGSKDFMKPILKSDAEDIPKKVMHSLFHYMSVFMIFSAFVLIMNALNMCRLFENGYDVVKFIGIIYAGFAVAQFIIALTSKVPGGIFKMFQWVFWSVIALLIFLGI